MLLIAGGAFAFFTLVYIFLTSAVLYNLYHYTLPGWTAVRLVVPLFFLLTALFFIFAVYFFFRTPWGSLAG